MLGGFFYIFLALRYSFYRDNATSELGWVMRVGYWGMNLFIFPISIALINLNFTMWIYMYNNMTVIEDASMNQKKYPCFDKKLGVYENLNKYDMLYPNNIRDIMGEKLWMWLLPIKH